MWSSRSTLSTPSSRGVDADWALHVCYGNRYARPAWEGHYDFPFPSVLRADVGRLGLEFARKGYDDLALLRRHGWDRELGLGVIDVKTEEIEPVEVVAARIRHALDTVGPDRLLVNPDCGLRHLSPTVVRTKLCAIVAGAAEVREQLHNRRRRMTDKGAEPMASGCLPRPTRHPVRRGS